MELVDFRINVRNFVKLQEEAMRLDCCSNSREYTYMKEKIDKYYLSMEHDGIPVFGTILNLLKDHRSNHGRVYFDEDRHMSLYEHTVDFLFGLINGTGLQVDMGDDNEIYSQAIIIAGLYHDSGKAVSRSHHELRAGEYIDNDLSFYPKQNTDLLKDLINNESKFFNPSETPEEISDHIKHIINKLSIKYSINENIIFRMLCAMFIADSTTMRRVYKMNEEYINLTFDNMSRLTLDDMDELINRFKVDPYV